MREPLLRPKDVPAPTWFGRYNFQREEDLARLTLTLMKGPSVLLLSGESGIGRRYLLQAAAHRLRQSGEKVEEILEIDLEGYDEEVGLAKFLELQVEKRREERGEPRRKLLDALLSAVRLGVRGTGWAALLSATLSLRKPISALGELLGKNEKGFSGEFFPAREAFAFFVQGLSGRVILHVAEPSFFHSVPSQENPRRWLPEVAERFPHVTLVISCKPDDQETDLVLGAQDEVERWELRRLDRDELRALLDLRLAPNEFPSDFAETLLRYTKGLPWLLGGIFWKLYRDGALDEDERLIWRVDEVRVAAILSEGLLDPVSRAFHEHPRHTQALWMFLLDAALCGQLVPTSLLLGLQAVDEDVNEELANWVDEELVERLSLFEDLEYSHPSFPRSVNVYRFREPILRLAVLEHFPLEKLRDRTALITPALRLGLPVRTRDEARLFLALADHLGEAERDCHLRDLGWWVGQEEADNLTEALIAAMDEGHLKPETLWGALLGTKSRWPSYRRLAVLNAYGTGPIDERGNPLGIPMERLTEFLLLRADLLHDLGQYQEALASAKQAAELAKDQRGKQSLEYLRALVLAGDLLRHLEAYASAQEILQEAWSLADRILGPEHTLTLIAKRNMATVLKEQGELIVARKLYEEILEAEDRLRGSEYPGTLLTKEGLAQILKDQGDLSRSREILEEVLSTESRLFGPEHPGTLVAKYNLALVLKDQGDLSWSRKIFEEVLEVARRVRGPAHPHTLATKQRLAEVLKDQSNLSQARAVYEEVLDTVIRVEGLEHPYTLKTKHRLAGVLRDQGNLSRAREIYEEVLEARTRTLGLEHPRTRETKEALCMLRDQETGESAESHR